MYICVSTYVYVCMDLICLNVCLTSVFYYHNMTHVVRKVAVGRPMLKYWRTAEKGDVQVWE